MPPANRTRRKPLPAHAAAALFPETTGADYAAIKADIKQQGQLHPIITVGEGADIKVLAGRTRQSACIELGIEPKYQPYQGNDPIAFVIGDNIHRRHLTAEQKRDLIAKLIKAQPKKSNRQIAKMAGRSHPHVAKVRKKLEQAGDVETVTTSIDTMGREQPAARAKKRIISRLLTPPSHQQMEKQLRNAKEANDLIRAFNQFLQLFDRWAQSIDKSSWSAEDIEVLTGTIHQGANELTQLAQLIADTGHAGSSPPGVGADTPPPTSPVRRAISRAWQPPRASARNQPEGRGAAGGSADEMPPLLRPRGRIIRRAAP
jgi:hypothetical protein